jgi:hypothetical protein
VPESREPASVAAEARPLSSAAQAVLDAVFDHWPGGYKHPGKPRCVAAALRAVADQVVPERLGLMHPVARAEAHAIRAEILAIAAELEAPHA